MRLKLEDNKSQADLNAELLSHFEVKDDPCAIIKAYDLEAIESLLKARADPNLFTIHGMALTSQVAININIDLSVLKLLITYGGNPCLPTKRSTMKKARLTDLSHEEFYQTLYESNDTTYTNLVHLINEGAGLAAMERLSLCFPNPEENIPPKYRINTQHLEDIYLQLATKILKYFEERKESNLKLVFIVGEHHNSYFSFIIELMVTYILREKRISKLLLESDEEDLTRRLSDGISFNIYGVVPSCAIPKLAVKLNFEIIPIDNWLCYRDAANGKVDAGNEESMKCRDRQMAIEINSTDEHAMCVVGDNHLYGLNVLNELNKDVFNISTMQNGSYYDSTQYSEKCKNFSTTDSNVLRIISPFDDKEVTLKAGYTWHMLHQMIQNIHLNKFEEALSEARRPATIWNSPFAFWNDNKICVRNSNTDSTKSSYFQNCQIL